MNKHIHIIVEGCDGVGKTTFINELQKLIKFRIVKGSDFSIAEQGVEKMYEYMKEIAHSEENLIIDRDFISNLVYAPLFDKNKLTDEMVQNLINVKNKHSIVIHLTASLDTVEKRIIARGDDYVNTEHLHDILESYEHIIGNLKSKMNIFSYNVDVFDTYNLARFIGNVVDGYFND